MGSKNNRRHVMKRVGTFFGGLVARNKKLRKTMPMLSTVFAVIAGQ
jgi:hypothetical protein